MPHINPDLSQVGPISAGVYRAKITACEVKTSKSGNPMIVPTFAIDVNGTEREKQSFIVYTGGGARSFMQLLRACLFDALADAYANKDGEKPAFNTDDLIGQELMVQIEPDTYNGEPSDKIAGYTKA